MRALATALRPVAQGGSEATQFVFHTIAGGRRPLDIRFGVDRTRQVIAVSAFGHLQRNEQLRRVRIEQTVGLYAVGPPLGHDGDAKRNVTKAAPVLRQDVDELFCNGLLWARIASRVIL